MIFNNEFEMNTYNLSLVLGLSHLFVKAVLYEHKEEFEHMGCDFKPIYIINGYYKADMSYNLRPSHILRLTKYIQKMMIGKTISVKQLKAIHKVIDELTFKDPFRKPHKVIVRKKQHICLG